MLAETPAMTQAWETAYSKFRASLPAKDLQKIRYPTSPADIVVHLQKWEGSRGSGTDVIQARIAKLQRFTGAIDQLVQGMPDPASLVWGSIRFVLNMVQDNLEEHGKICAALFKTLDALPRIELYSSVLADSPFFSSNIVDLFAALIDFWHRASKFYRRRRLWNFARTAWTDYDAEFARLEVKMRDSADKIEKGVHAEHLKMSVTFMREQRLDIAELKKRGEEQERDELLETLTPDEGSIYDYVLDHEAVRNCRLDGTCGWIFERDAFKSWLSAPPGEMQSILWIAAGPGCGKSTLLSFVIDNLISNPPKVWTQPRKVVYYYFRSSSGGTRSSAADAFYSLVWQLCHDDTETVKLVRSMFPSSTSYGGKRHESRRVRQGSSRAFRAWRMLEYVLEMIPDPVLVVDGLDGCHYVDEFLEPILRLCREAAVKILVASRREGSITKHLGGCATMTITDQDVHADVQAYVETEVSCNVRLSHPRISREVIRVLTSHHGGMFLWVVLMLRELSTCATVEDVRSTLESIPVGLEAVYSAIVKRLSSELTRSAAEVARRVLAWVFNAARPLEMKELREALCLQYRTEGSTLLADEAFPYSDEEIEAICGSFVRIQFGKILPAHETASEFVRQYGFHNDRTPGPRFLPDALQGSLDLASVLLTYITEECCLPLERFNQSLGMVGLPRIDTDGLDFQNKTFLDYACNFWLYHLIQCPADRCQEALALLHSKLACSTTASWVEVTLRLDPGGLWRLVISVEELDDWLGQLEVNGQATGALYAAVDAWSTGVLRFLNNYNMELGKRPYIIWFGRIRFSNHANGDNECHKCLLGKGEHEWTLDSALDCTSHHQSPENRELGHEQDSLLKARFGFIIFEPIQGLYISGEKICRSAETIFLQEVATGRRLVPMKAEFEFKKWGGAVVDAKISRCGKYFAIAHRMSFSVWELFPNIKFSKRLARREWAGRLFVRKYPDDFEVRADCLAFGDGGTLFTPIGRYVLPSPESHPLGSCIAQSSMPTQMYFSGDGKYVFSVRTLDGTQTLSRARVSQSQDHGVESMELMEHVLEKESRITPSSTGRYAVIFSSDQSWRARKEIRSQSATLLDTTTGISYDLDNYFHGRHHSKYLSFHFTRSDTELVVFSIGKSIPKDVSADIAVTVLALDQCEPRLCATNQFLGKIRAHSELIDNLPVCTIDGTDRGWIVQCDRIVQQVRFDRKGVTFPGGTQPREGRPRAIYHSQISGDARRRASVRIDGSDVHIQVMDAAQDAPGKILLDRHLDLGMKGDLAKGAPVGLDSKCELLVVGSVAFTLGLGDTHETPIRLCEEVDLKGYPGWKCNISSCGYWVAFEKPQYTPQSWERREPQPAKLLLVRVDREKRMASTVRTEYVTSQTVQFHPILGLAAVSPFTSDGADLDFSLLKLPSTSDASSTHGHSLPTITANKISIPSSLLTNDIHPHLLFSDCGSFTYLSPMRDLDKSRLVVSLISDVQYISPRCISTDRPWHSIKRCFSLRADSKGGQVRLTMYTFSEPEEACLPQLQVSVRSASVEILAFVPVELGDWQAHAHLVIPGDDDAKLRLLLESRSGRPHLLKELGRTWGEILNQLEKDVEEQIESELLSS